MNISLTFDVEICSSADICVAALLNLQYMLCNMWQIQLGNKILVYISCCLAGRAYPLGDIAMESVAVVRTCVLHCLTALHSSLAAVDEPLYPHLWTLIQFDTREFFNVLSLAFADAGLTDAEKQGVVDILLRMMVDNSGFTQYQVM